MTDNDRQIADVDPDNDEAIADLDAPDLDREVEDSLREMQRLDKLGIDWDASQDSTSDVYSIGLDVPLDPEDVADVADVDDLDD